MVLAVHDEFNVDIIILLRKHKINNTLIYD